MPLIFSLGWDRRAPFSSGVLPPPPQASCDFHSGGARSVRFNLVSALLFPPPFSSQNMLLCCLRVGGGWVSDSLASASTLGDVYGR